MERYDSKSNNLRQSPCPELYFYLLTFDGSGPGVLGNGQRAQRFQNFINSSSSTEIREENKYLATGHS
ncbi:hypothetical protein M378DRAFT_327425 [Amanita muscaria Koide BX008]|uniref:Uncharacterized protein n=1 Tax=Amanita muscaria (strain Koide BX008) TaxID=946122 RepID=A0A0C2WZ55_AMAMK|nr:hypothetical protein M378DRAFT_327425 [Amanita muscaria Koide BX008]